MHLTGDPVLCSGEDSVIKKDEIFDVAKDRVRICKDLIRHLNIADNPTTRAFKA